MRSGESWQTVPGHKSYAAKVLNQTIGHLARMYYEASKLIPVSGISLKGILDYQGKGRHFWTWTQGRVSVGLCAAGGIYPRAVTQGISGSSWGN